MLPVHADRNRPRRQHRHPVTSIILVDTTAPSTPTVTFTGLSAGNTYDNGAGTLFFRPSAAGTFTVNAASTDTQSGIKAGTAGYTFGSLNSNGGTNFVTGQTNGALSVTFDGTTTGPTTQRTVSSTNGSGLNSATANYNVTQDSTAPTGGAASVPAFSSHARLDRDHHDQLHRRRIGNRVAT